MSPEQRAAVEESLRRRRLGGVGDAIPRRSGDGPAPLSFAQQRIWFLEQWEPGGFTHNGARAFRLLGALDAAALERALTAVVQRHEVLRTVYVLHDREPRQRPLEEWSVAVPVIDLGDLAPGPRGEELGRRMRALSREPFDLTTDLMLRGTLFRLGPGEHVLLVRLHHIAFDAFSDRIFHAELGTLYAAFAAGREPEPPDLPVQYADYAVWQRDYLAGRRLDELIAHWRTALAGAPPLLRLPTDGPRRTPQRHEGRHREVSLQGALIPAIADLARAEGATPYMVLLAAFAVLLYRITGEEDVVVGTPIANRGHVEVQSLIGFFSNTVALRVRLDGNPSFREVVARARAAAVAAYAHQELPFERVVEELRVPRDARHNPIFQVNFRAQTEPRPLLELPGVRAEPLSIDIGFSRFDLALELRYEDDAVGGYIEYDLDLFAEGTIDALALELSSALERLLEHPDRPILEHRLGPSWVRTAAPRMRGTARSRRPADRSGTMEEAG
jgi:hypothetical protein